jgi:4-hydroxy-tetrahydrodipicolinate synthase
VSEPVFRGILAATVTPFTPDRGTVDYAKIPALVDYLIDAGVGGLVPCGSTGEFAHMTTDERKLVVEAFVNAARRRVPVIAHTGALTTSETIELSRHAEAAGASALMVVPPYYEKLAWDELHNHYATVAQSVQIPIVLYNIPSASSTELTPSRVADLAHIPGVRFVKDSSGSARTLNELVLGYGDDVTTWNGWDSLTFYGFVLGTPASIWGAANFIPEQCVALFESVQQSDMAEARRLWAAIWPIVDFLESCTYVAAVKAGCQIIGIDMGAPRLPFLPLPDDRVAELRLLIDHARAVAVPILR